MSTHSPEDRKNPQHNMHPQANKDAYRGSSNMGTGQNQQGQPPKSAAAQRTPDTRRAGFEPSPAQHAQGTQGNQPHGNPDKHRK
jgi:hypothetical protein